MKYINKDGKLNKDVLIMMCGIVLSVMLCIPFYINGRQSIVTYHDQLDGELMTYILNARHMFDGLDNYPELMNGIPKGGMVSPAVLFIPLYRVFEPFTVFLISITFIKISAFVSMYLLLRWLRVREEFAGICATAFMCMPFYYVYGLSIPAMPLVLYAFLKASYTKKYKSTLVCAGTLIFYGLSSSLALCGFAIIICALLYLVYLCICKNRSALLHASIVFLSLCFTYILTNLTLIGQILHIGNTYVSHKTELIIPAVSLHDSLIMMLKDGMDYAQFGQAFGYAFIIPALVIAIMACIKKKDVKNVKFIAPLVSFGFIIVLAVLYAVYNCGVTVNLRNMSEGVLHTFNFGRIGWLCPVCWCVFIGTLAEYVTDILSDKKRIFLYLEIGVFALSMLAICTYNLYKSDVKPNVMKLIHHGDYYMMTFEQFFAEEEFAKIDEVIGRNKEDYRVVSLGIYPAAAAYNGFFCLDAYSNNYDVEYKHEFRDIIKPELDKSEYLTDWYDNWGNRCYIVLNESNNYFTFEKRWSPVSNSIDLDNNKLLSMGCEYIISASYIMNPDETNVTLLTPEPIVSDGGWYRLWVYKVNAE